LANFVLDYSLTKNKTVFLKINNLLDKDYEQIKGYQQERLAFYGGLKAKF